VDLSDEIAYTSHDIDDGLTSGLLDFDGLAQVPLFKRNADKVKAHHPQLSKDKIKYQVVRLIIDELVTNLLDETLKRIAKFNVKTVDDVRRASEEMAAFSNEARKDFLDMKSYLFQNMYRHQRVTRVEAKAAKVIQELFKLYESDPSILPSNTREKIKNKLEPVRRIICDYIAGMTDRYAIEEHEKLTNPSIRV
jgi:dGTPase